MCKVNLLNHRKLNLNRLTSLALSLLFCTGLIACEKSDSTSTSKPVGRWISPRVRRQMEAEAAAQAATLTASAAAIVPAPETASTPAVPVPTIDHVATATTTSLTTKPSNLDELLATTEAVATQFAAITIPAVDTTVTPTMRAFAFSDSSPLEPSSARNSVSLSLTVDSIEPAIVAVTAAKTSACATEPAPIAAPDSIREKRRARYQAAGLPYTRATARATNLALFDEQYAQYRTETAIALGAERHEAIIRASLTPAGLAQSRVLGERRATRK